MPRELHDHYFHQARRDGYVSRAAYKLIEIDERKRVLRKGDRVLDCGAAPGSWVQVAARRVGPSGLVVGIDLKPASERLREENARFIEGDLYETTATDLLEAAASRRGSGGAPRLFDVVLSDMAPNTTGDQTIDHHASVRLCHAVLDRCRAVLEPGGNLVMKAFEGETYPDLLARAARVFDSARGFKPRASRQVSREMYVVARGYRGPDAEEPPPPVAPPRPQPRRGWGSKED